MYPAVAMRLFFLSGGCRSAQPFGVFPRSGRDSALPAHFCPGNGTKGVTAAPLTPLAHGGVRPGGGCLLAMLRVAGCVVACLPASC